MSAPLSNKAAAGGIGALTGGSTAVAVAELLGQIPVLQDTNPNVVKALGGIIVVLGAMYGSRWRSWWKKESDEFIAYAANESGKMLVDVGTKLGVPQTDLTVLTQKIDALAAKIESKTQEDAERLLQHYFPTSTGTTAPAVTVTPVPPVAPTPAPAPAPAAADPGAGTDPVLTDDPPPAAETDPVLAD